MQWRIPLHVKTKSPACFGCRVRMRLFLELYAFYGNVLPEEDGALFAEFFGRFGGEIGALSVFGASAFDLGMAL